MLRQAIVKCLMLACIAHHLREEAKQKTKIFLS